MRGASRAGAAICIGAVMAIVSRLRGEAPDQPAPGGWRELGTDELRGSATVPAEPATADELRGDNGGQS